MKKIVFIPTWLCQNTGLCSYCDYRLDGNTLYAFDQIHTIGEPIVWEKWLQLLSPFAPYLLELTGGEPTLMPNLHRLLSNLPQGSKWAITSNTLFKKEIELMPADNCIHWTASYHYRNDEMFISNLEIIRAKQIPVSVTLVITPENFEIAKEKIAMFNELGFPVNVHPVLKQDFTWSNHVEMWNHIQSLEGVNVVRDIGTKWSSKRFESCEAGKDYFCLMPDGTVLRCYSQIFTKENLGFIGDFKPLESMTPCNMECHFPCDLQVKKQ